MLFQTPVISSLASFVILYLQLSLALECGFQDRCAGRNPQGLAGESSSLAHPADLTGGAEGREQPASGDTSAPLGLTRCLGAYLLQIPGGQVKREG